MAHGATAEVKYDRGYPVTFNHSDETEFATGVANGCRRRECRQHHPNRILGAEDFSYMLEARPGAFIFIGNGDTAGLHNAAYDFNETTRCLTASATGFRWLKPHLLHKTSGGLVAPSAFLEIGMLLAANVHGTDRRFGNPVLSVQNLTTSFRVDGGWKSVVRNMSFDIAPRETVAIVGESGSGKSVTSLSIMRLLDKKTSRIEGKVMLGGRDLLALPEEEMRKVRGKDISMIFQETMTSLKPIFPIGKQDRRGR